MTSADKTAQQDAVILVALPHVPFDGWSRKTLRAACTSAGLPANAAERLFPAGPKDAVSHFIALADRLMLEDLKAHDFAALKVRQKVALALRVRLERWTPHREAVRRALALAPLPSFAGRSLAGWYGTVDAIWRAAGDRSTDFNFYTKRGLLAAVYAATLLYWLDDRSEGCAATWSFMERRLADVMKIPQFKGRMTEALKQLPDPLQFMRRMKQRMAPKWPSAESKKSV